MEQRTIPTVAPGAPALAIVAAVATLGLGAPAGAQLVTPSDWKWVTDAPATLVTGQELTEGSWRFVAMPPGWHVTMGPGGILYDPAIQADHRFALEAEIFLFPGETDGGYGIFFGGSNLDGPDRRYYAFLARRDGAAGVFRFTGARAEPIVDWARHEAVIPHTTGTAKNILRVEAERDSIAFLVNGATVAKLPRQALDANGHFGLRIDAGVNVHTSNLDFTRRLAPTRAMSEPPDQPTEQHARPAVHPSHPRLEPAPRSAVNPQLEMPTRRRPSSDGTPAASPCFRSPSSGTSAGCGSG